MKAIDRRKFIGQAAVMTGAALSASVSGCASMSRSGSEGYQIGCYTRPWDQHELPVALDQIAAAGFKYAGIMTAKGKTWVVISPQTTPAEAQKIGSEVSSRGLKTISVYGDFKPVNSSTTAEDDLRRLIDHCAACGSPQLLLGGTTDAALLPAYMKTITACCEYAAGNRVMLSIKPHGGQNATGAACRKLVEQVGHPNFRIWYDPGNIFYYSDGRLDPVDDCRDVDGLVAGVSVKDFVPPKEVLVNPGEGKVKLSEVMGRLRAGGFKAGPLVVECLRRGSIEEITAAASRTRQFLERLATETAA